MEALGARLAACIDTASIIFLSGDLGAGKTTLARGFIRAKGHQGTVKSPTYAIIEPYELTPLAVYHCDFYRLTSSCDELECLGLRDYLEQNAVCLMEWPERLADLRCEPDLWIRLGIQARGRHAVISAESPCGARIVACLATTPA